MDILYRIFEGLFISAFGLFLVLRAQLVIDFLGTMDWADQKFGGGGTRLVYKFFGTILAIVGFMVMTNLWGVFIDATLGSVFPARRL